MRRLALLAALLCPALVAAEPGEEGCPDFGTACLALAVFSEARGEGWDGQAAVVHTILNRVAADGWREDICEVVLQPGQFDGIARWTPPRDPESIDPAAWRLAIQVSEAVIAGDYELEPAACRTATHFYSGDAPSWAAGMEEVCRIGGHVFMREVSNVTASR